MKIYMLWDELPTCCKECKNIQKHGMSDHIFECKGHLILPTKKKSCMRQEKKREPIKNRLIRFLKDNNIEEKFSKNRIKQKRIPNITLATKSSPFGFFQLAFFWDKTPEKYWFWKKINSEWLYILCEEYPEYLPKGFRK